MILCKRGMLRFVLNAASPVFIGNLYLICSPIPHFSSFKSVVLLGCFILRTLCFFGKYWCEEASCSSGIGRGKHC